MRRIENPDRALTLLERSIEKTEGCWFWRGYVCPNGYGKIWIGSRTDGTYQKVWIHRLAFMLFCGPLAEGEEVHHTCGEKLCVNPAHLQVLSASAHRNITTKDTCIRGHARVGKTSDIYVYPNGDRECRRCRRENQRERRAKCAA